jgi:hypothetical protein
MAAKTPKAKSTAVDPEEMHFRTVADALANHYENVTWGKMMSSPGVRFGDKFFAFYYQKSMVCRFGRDFKPESIGISNYSLLSPFKTKPPLHDWFCITVADQERWVELATLALHKMAGDAIAPRAEVRAATPQPTESINP